MLLPPPGASVFLLFHKQEVDKHGHENEKEEDQPVDPLKKAGDRRSGVRAIALPLLRPARHVAVFPLDNPQPQDGATDEEKDRRGDDFPGAHGSLPSPQGAFPSFRTISSTMSSMVMRGLYWSGTMMSACLR